MSAVKYFFSAAPKQKSDGLLKKKNVAAAVHGFQEHSGSMWVRSESTSEDLSMLTVQPLIHTFLLPLPSGVRAGKSSRCAVTWSADLDWL